MDRSHLQRVKILYNQTLPALEEGTRRLAEISVPFTQAWRYTKIYNWQQFGFRLYYGSVHWVEAIEPGPFGEQWYRIYDDLTGFPYYVNPLHVRPIPLQELAPITPDIPLEKKRIEVNLTTQILTAYEYDKQVFKTMICSGIPNGPRGANGIPTRTPTGEFRISDKMPAKHMGDGKLFAKYNRPNGSVLLRADVLENEVMVVIQDTGIGIPEEALPHLFQKFYRVREHESRASGTGLGLSICKQIVQGHGRRIEVKSKIGVGTVFLIYLPRTSKTTPR